MPARPEGRGRKPVFAPARSELFGQHVFQDAQNGHQHATAHPTRHDRADDSCDIKAAACGSARRCSAAAEHAQDLATKAAAKGNNARLSKLFETLPEEEAGVARATMIDNLGKAGPGAQNAAGDEFSFNAFLTNWNKLGASAKNAIFRGENREAIDKLALIAERSKAAAKYQNYSNTGLAVMGAATGSTAIASMFTLGKVLAGQYAAGRLLASPKVAKALLGIAQAKNPEAVAARINNLSGLAAREPVLSAEITQLQQKLMQAMNDNGVSRAVASPEGQNEQNK